MTTTDELQEFMAQYTNQAQKTITEKVVLSDAYIIPYFDNRFKMKDEDIPHQSKYCVGDRYILQGCECDEFDMPIKEYELKGVLGTVNGIVLDSLVMKQISGPTSTIFSLTKGDCNTLNIPFERELQIFPQNLNWVKVSQTEETKNIEFNPSNLSTYPICIIDKTIRNMIIKLSGFRTECGDIITPDGSRMFLDSFVGTLNIKTKKTIFGDNIHSRHIPNGSFIDFEIVTKDVGVGTTNRSVVDMSGSIYLELNLLGMQSYSDDAMTSDKLIGIQPSKLNGDFNEFFEVSWIEQVTKLTSPNFDLMRKVNALNRSKPMPTLSHYRTLPTIEEIEKRWRDLGMKSSWHHSKYSMEDYWE